MSDEPLPFVYLDNHATTQVDPRVLEVMLPFFSQQYGNAGSKHSLGEQAKQAVDNARAEIAQKLGVQPKEIVFTSGATESNNLAIRGIFERSRKERPHFISVQTEHKAVLTPLERLTKRGAEVSLLNVEQHGSPNAGLLNPEQITEAITENTILVSVMMVNSEMGVIQPIAEIGRICRDKGVLFHCDATQAVGKIPVDLETLNVDLMSFSAHKIYGPKGVGGLYVRSGKPTVRLAAQITGGGQQEGRRSGTVNVPGSIGMAKTLSICLEELPAEIERLTKLRNGLAKQLLENISGVEINGPALDATNSVGEPLRLPNNLNFSISGIEGESLMLMMPQLAISSGATCAADNPEPSHVLKALGRSEDEIRCSLRFGLGRFTTPQEIALAAEWVADVVKMMRNFAV